MAEVTLAELAKSLNSEDGGRFADGLVASIRSSLAASKSVPLPGLGLFSPADARGKADVLADLSSSLGGASRDRVDGLMKAFLDVVKKELLVGRRILLDGLGALEVRFERPKIERQPKGHRLIRPASSSLSFTPAGEERVVFTPADDLRSRLESYKESSIMLVVPERDFFSRTLEYYFEGAGWKIEVFTKMADALAQIESGKAYLAIVDAGLPDHQKFCSMLKTRRETANVPLILMYPDEAALKSPPEVRIVGDENLAQPFEFRELLDTADAEILRAAEEELIFLQQVNLVLPTEEAEVEKAIETAQKMLETSGLNEESQVAMSAAFREGVVNAAQHGNKYKRDKKIRVQYLLDPEKVTAVVTDEGPGFNHQQYVKSGSTRDAITAARERHAQGRMGGLGIMLMLRCCDRLEYNDSGNQITLTKHLKP